MTVNMSSPVESLPTRHSDEEQMTHSSPVNGHVSPQRHSPSDKSRQLIIPSSGTVITNGDSNSQTIVVTASEDRCDHSLSHNNNNNNNTNNSSVLHHNEVHIKSEPLDPLPPLASPAMVEVISGGVDRNRDLEPSPPATVISLTPAQPYPLTFSAPIYDIGGTGQYTVQVLPLLAYLLISLL
jgi:hypothetical protein